MARKLASPVSESSQKENTGPHARGQPVSWKAKGNGAARAVRVESDEEDDMTQNGTQGGDAEEEDIKTEEEEDAEEEEEGSPKGRKRARANTLGDARPSQSGIKSKVKMEPKTLPRDDDGYAVLVYINVFNSS